MKARPWLAIFGVSLSGACVDSRVVFGEDFMGGAGATASGTGGMESAVGASGAIGASSAVGAGATSGRAGEPGNPGGTRSGAGGEGGEADAGSGVGGEPSSGAGGSEPGTSCADTCRNGTCVTAGARVVCQCHSGFVLDGASCRRPKSCAELHRTEPSLANGAYSLQPSAAKAAFPSYCLMTGNGGGWTLVLNQGTEFDPSGTGSESELAYAARGTNLAYSSVVLESDLMLDVRMEPIASDNHTARAVISGVHAASRGRTVRELFTSGPYYVDAEDNGNLSLTSSIQCNFSPADLGPLFCQSPVLVFGKQEASCSPSALRFAISGAESYTQPWERCAGWPQAPVAGGQQRFPNSFRVWIR